MARIVGSPRDTPAPRTDITREIRRVDATAARPSSDMTKSTPSTPSTRSTPNMPPRGAVVTEDATAPGGILIDPSGAWPAPDVSTQMERPILTSRQCTRSGCAESAAVTLTYNYARQQVWIDALLPERDPHVYDLCERHADRMSVPHGWHLDDRRHVRGGRPTSLIAV